MAAIIGRLRKASTLASRLESRHAIRIACTIHFSHSAGADARKDLARSQSHSRRERHRVSRLPDTTVQLRDIDPKDTTQPTE